MKQFLAIGFAILALGAAAIDFNGKKEFVQVSWKNSGMPRPVFSVSFKLKMPRTSLVMPRGQKSGGRIVFWLGTPIKNFPGFRSARIFFVINDNPQAGYTGIQANSFDAAAGKDESIRYNIFWRAEGGVLPVNEFVQVVIGFDGARMYAYFNGTDVRTMHRTAFFSFPEVPPELRFTFGASGGGRYATPCSIEEVAIYDRLLTTEEVKKLQQGISPAQIVGVRVNYPLKNSLKPAVISPGFSLIAPSSVKKRLK